jgi:hypothetical protein
VSFSFKAGIISANFKHVLSIRAAGKVFKGYPRYLRPWERHGTLIRDILCGSPARYGVFHYPDAGNTMSGVQQRVVVYQTSLCQAVAPSSRCRWFGVIMHLWPYNVPSYGDNAFAGNGAIFAEVRVVQHHQA